MAVHRCHPYRCPVLDYFDELDRSRRIQLGLIADDLVYRLFRDYEHEQALLFEEETLALAWHHECPGSPGVSEQDSTDENASSDHSHPEEHAPEDPWQCDCCPQRVGRGLRVFRAVETSSVSSASRDVVVPLEEQGIVPALPQAPSEHHPIVAKT